MINQKGEERNEIADGADTLPPDENAAGGDEAAARRFVRKLFANDDPLLRGVDTYAQALHKKAPIPRCIRGKNGRFVAHPDGGPFAESIFSEWAKGFDAAKQVYAEQIRLLMKNVEKFDLKETRAFFLAPLTTHQWKGFRPEPSIDDVLFASSSVLQRKMKEWHLPRLEKELYQSNADRQRLSGIIVSLDKTGDLSKALALVVLDYQKEAVREIAAELSSRLSSGELDSCSRDEVISVTKEVCERRMGDSRLLVSRLCSAGVITNKDTEHLLNADYNIRARVENYSTVRLAERQQDASRAGRDAGRSL